MAGQRFQAAVGGRLGSLKMEGRGGLDGGGYRGNYLGCDA